MDADLKALRSFVRLASTLSFTRAALDLQITQPQLSARIRILEDKLGFRLFARSSRFVALTPDGQRLLDIAADVLRQTDRFEDMVENIRTGMDTVVRVGAVDMFRPVWRPLLMDYMRRGRNICIEVEMLQRSGLDFATNANNLDCAFVIMIEGEKLSEDFEAITLSTQQSGLLLSSASPIAQQKLLTKEHLNGQQVALFRRELMPLQYDRFVSALHPTSAQIVRLPEPTEEGMVHFAREAGALVACSRWWVKPEDAPEGVVHRVLDGLSCDVTLFMVRRRHKASKAGQALWRFASNRMSG